MNERTEKITVPAMLTNTWLKYDKNITSALRTMGFNSIKAFQKSNALKEHYFAVSKHLKTDPNKGMLALHKSIESIQSSTKYKALLWIESNVSKYIANKTGKEKIETLANEVEEYLKGLTDIPTVLAIRAACTTTKDRDKGRLENNITNNFSLNILYDSAITITKDTAFTKEPFRLDYSIPIGQQITGIIDDSIADLDIETANVNEILKNIFKPNELKKSFKFAGPCIYTPSNGENLAGALSNYTADRYQSYVGVGHGCLGNMDEDFENVVNQGSIEVYMNFISQWFTLLNSNSHPYRQPKELVYGSGGNVRCRLLGFSSDAAIQYIFQTPERPSLQNLQNLSNYCLIYYEKKSPNNPPYIDYRQLYVDTLKGLDAASICNNCTLNECEYNPEHKDITTQTSVQNSKDSMDNDIVGKLCLLHNKLMNDEYKTMPVDAQIRCLKEDSKYLITPPSNVTIELYKEYKSIFNKYTIDWDKIKTYWENKYE